MIKISNNIEFDKIKKYQYIVDGCVNVDPIYSFHDENQSEIVRKILDYYNSTDLFSFQV